MADRGSSARPGRRAKLVIDIGAGRVELGLLTLQNQWVDFYAVLALARVEHASEGAYVSAETVSRSGPWRHKAVASVGKEIARHLKHLALHGLDDMVVCRGRTKAWSLTLSPASISFRPDLAAVRSWVSSRSSGGRGDAPGVGRGWVHDMHRLVEATAALQGGKAESALGLLEEPPAPDTEPTLGAWHALLRGRAAYQHDDHDLVMSLHDAWMHRIDAPGRSVAARLRALVAHKDRFSDPVATLAMLHRLAAELELHGDISALGSVLNVMGLLARRSGDPRGALHYHLRAVALFGIVGDYPSMQGGLFNIALCQSRILADAGKKPDETVLSAVELCLLICKRFGVGGDSAQAEIAGARWAFEMGDVERARRYLADAEVIVREIESTYDQACFRLLQAELEFAHPSGASDPARDLGAAERLFGELGDDGGLAEVRRVRRAYRSATGARRRS